MKGAWYTLAWAVLIAGVYLSHEWLHRPQFEILPGGQGYLMRHDTRSGRVWMYVLSTNVSGWAEVK